MIYRIRVILDVDDDVLRDIEISSTSTLEDLHNAIIKSFGFLGNEMASFYESDENWTQNDELPLESLDTGINKKNEILNTVLTFSKPKLIYVYDFLNLWTFFVELKEEGEIIPGVTYPNFIHSKGDVPEEAPPKIFEADGEENYSNNDMDMNEDISDEDSSFY